MATAKVNTTTEKVEKVIVEEKTVRKINLELSEDEAVTLNMILRCIGGSFENTRGKIVNEINNKIEDIMTVYVNGYLDSRGAFNLERHRDGSMYFKNNDDYLVTVHWAK